MFPLDEEGLPLLIDPSVDDPRDHLLLTPTSGRYEQRTPRGDKSIEVFGLNRDKLVRGRLNALAGLQAVIIRYRQQRDRNQADTLGLERVAREYPFAAVLTFLLDLAAGPGRDLLEADCRAVLERYPEIRSWG